MRIRLNTQSKDDPPFTIGQKVSADFPSGDYSKGEITQIYFYKGTTWTVDVYFPDLNVTLYHYAASSFRGKPKRERL